MTPLPDRPVSAGPGHRARALPVTDQDLQPAVRQWPDRDGVRGEAAVHDPVPVRVGHRLGDLPQQSELVLGREAARVVGQPQVEPLEPVIERVDQADAEVAVHQVPRAQQPVAGQPGHDPVLVLGDLADPRPGRSPWRRAG